MKRPDVYRGRRADIDPKVLAYARSLGWMPRLMSNGYSATRFNRPGEAVWLCARGWVFARLIGCGDSERFVDRRYHCHCGLGLLDALDDSGPGPGAFHLYLGGKKVTRRPVGRSDERVYLMYAYGLGPAWRDEMAVGVEVLCGLRVGEDVVQYVVRRVT